MGLAADARVLTIWVGTLICISLVNLIFLPGVFAQPQQDWDKLVAAAEKEGEVTIYGQARAGVAKSIHAFAEAYPKIKINFVGGQVVIFPRKFSLNDARARILSMLQSAAVRR